MDEIIKFNNFDEETERQAYLDEKVIGATIKKYIGALKPTGATYKKWARHYLTYLESRNIQDAPNTNEEELYFEKNPFEIDLTPENINDFYAAVNTEEQISIFDTDAEKVIATAGEKHLLNKSVRAYIGLMLSDFASCSAFLTAYLLWNSKESGHIVYDAAKDKAIFDILAPFDEVLTKHGYATTERKAAELLINADEDAIPALFAAFEEVQKTVKSTYLINFDVKVLQSLLEFAEKYGGGTEKSRNGYIKMLNNEKTNIVAKAIAQSRRISLNDDNKYALKINDYEIVFDSYEIKTAEMTAEKNKYATFASKFLNICLYELTRANINPDDDFEQDDNEKNKNQIILTTGQICELMGKDNTAQERREIRRKVKITAPLLENIKIGFYKNNWRNSVDKRIIVDINTVENTDKILVSFSVDILKQLTKDRHIAFYPTPLLSGDERNAVQYWVGNYIATQSNTNFGKKIRDIHLIKTVIENSGLPTIEEVKNGKRDYNGKIRKPLINALDGLVKENTLQSWEYCNEKGEIIKKSTVDRDYNFAKWAELRIKTPLKNYPSEEKAEMKERSQKKYAKQQKKR